MTTSRPTSSSSCCLVFQYIKDMGHQLYTSGHFKDNLFLDTCLKSKSLHCRDLIFKNTDCVPLKFFEDGSYLISGGDKKCILLWHISKVLGCERQPKPVEMQTKHMGKHNYIDCLAISGNNKVIVSCGAVGETFIHDTNTTELLNIIAPRNMSILTGVGSVAFPKESDGNVFALAGRDSILRIYDLRCNNALPVIETDGPKRHLLQSVDFSPASSTHLAVAGDRGTRVIDFRNDPNKSVFSFPFSDITHSVEYNQKGTRLLCCEGDKQLVIYDLPAPNQVAKNIQLTAASYSYPFIGTTSCCFAGTDDELVAATSYDESVYIWSVPDRKEQEQTITEPLMVLSGQGLIPSICYSRQNCALASADNKKTIKIWTPYKLPCPSADGEQLPAEDDISDSDDNSNSDSSSSSIEVDSDSEFERDSE